MTLSDLYADQKMSWMCIYRAVTRSENLRGHIVLGGDNVSPPVKKWGGGTGRSPPAPALATGLQYASEERHSSIIACMYTE